MEEKIKSEMQHNAKNKIVGTRSSKQNTTNISLQTDTMVSMGEEKVALIRNPMVLVRVLLLMVFLL